MENQAVVEIPHQNDGQVIIKKKAHYPRLGKKVEFSEDDQNVLKDDTLKFDEQIVKRRAAMGLLPNVQDPEGKMSFRLSELKSSTYYEISENYMVAYNEGGYRLCRANRGFITEGNYYWEFKFWKQNPDSHCRFGISTLRAGLEVPVGYDEYGFCVCDKGGSYHNRKLNPDVPGFEPKDKVGLGLSIHSNGENSLVGELNYYKNHEFVCTLYENIDFSKRWFPSLSIYKGAKVTANFNPTWKPEGYTAAALYPVFSKEQPISVIKLLSSMRGFSSVNMPPQDIYNAIMVALTPIYAMPY